VSFSAALTGDTDAALRAHLDRPDGQEDVCFALWRPSHGAERLTALVQSPILPLEGERRVHGNASFEGSYLIRAAGIAAEAKAGLALLHSHPGGREWQGMSPDDINAESGNAARVRAITGLPLLGMTLATRDGGWSGRLWERDAPQTYSRKDCESVRVIASGLRVTHHPTLRPPPRFREELTRTISAWGEEAQANLARLRIGVVGLGSVGSIIVEALARMGVADIRLIDFDAVELLNLDRILNTRREHAAEGIAKVAAIADALETSATAEAFHAQALEWSVVEPEGFAAALDCDVLFSCVDRPWPRYALNVAGYSHLIPVIDGGIVVSQTRKGKMRGADWRAHIVAPGRRCLECLGQYDPGAVQLEREGRLDDPSYIRQLNDDHFVKRNENVFAFSLGCASLELSQFISMVIAPGGITDVGAQLYHLSTGTLDRETDGCKAQCFFAGPLLAKGDASVDPTAPHEVAENARAKRAAASPPTAPDLESLSEAALRSPGRRRGLRSSLARRLGAGKSPGV
jgi:molybdopterin/thiamine biosynthesis adenylyltransferase